MIDPDVPIPYSLTKKGRRDLAAAELEQLTANCPHEWQANFITDCLECRVCGEVAQPRKQQSIPSYLHPKD